MRWESLRRTEAGWQHSALLRETEIMIAMRTAAGRGTERQPREREEGLQELGIFPTWGKLCVTFFFFFLLRLIKFMFSGDPSTGVSVSWTVTLLRMQYVEQRQKWGAQEWGFQYKYDLGQIFNFSLYAITLSKVVIYIKLFGKGSERMGSMKAPASELFCY